MPSPQRKQIFSSLKYSKVVNEVQVLSANPSRFPTALLSNHVNVTTIMRVLNSLICFFVFAASAWERPIETGTAIPTQRCDVECYIAYRHLMGDTIDSTNWVQESFSHDKTVKDLAMHAQVNAEAKEKADTGKPVSCMDCQSYLDQCQEPLVHYKVSRIIDGGPITCEMSLCNSGLLHCRAGGQCERRICKDLITRTTYQPSAQAPECKDCFKPWIECIHDLCLSPTHDGYADRLASLNCYKQDQAQCTKHMWQELSTSPKAFCVARCWANTPSHCHTGGRCAHPEYSSSGIDFNTHPLTPPEYSIATLSRGCNTFRDGCLQTCNLANVHNRCTKKCDKRYRKSSGTKRQLGKEECEERTCWDECRDRTCCLGPEQCRAGGEAFRCSDGKGLDCRTYEAEDSS
jgi:hypothetical protein